MTIKPGISEILDSVVTGVAGVAGAGVVSINPSSIMVCCARISEMFTFKLRAMVFGSSLRFNAFTMSCGFIFEASVGFSQIGLGGVGLGVGGVYTTISRCGGQ